MEPSERPKTLQPINDNYCRSLVPVYGNANGNPTADANRNSNENALITGADNIDSGGQGRLVKQSVRSVVGNLENVLGNLQGIVGDIRILVNRIECVSNKLDRKFGAYWKKGYNDNDTKSLVIDTDNGSTMMKQQGADSFECMQFSPDFDWTYITMATYQDSPFSPSSQFEFERSLGANDNECYRGDLTEDESEDLSEASLMSLTSTDASRCSSIPSSCSRHSILSATTTPSSVASDDIFSPQFGYIDIFHVCCQTPGDLYCGVYEILMESSLENTKNLNDSFESSDDEDEDEELATRGVDDDEDYDDDNAEEVEVTSVGDYKANYDRDLNTWTTFTLLHTDSIQDTDDYFSETKSDILNDNTLEKLESTIFRSTREKFRGSESSIFENIAFKDNPFQIC